MKLLLVPVAALLLAACNNKKTNPDIDKAPADTATVIEIDEPVAETVSVASITGKWKPVEIDMTDMDLDEKMEILEHATIEFTADGKYIALSNEENETGTYTYDEKTKMLTSISSDGTSEVIKAEISNDKLRVTTEDGTMTFKRISR